MISDQIEEFLPGIYRILIPLAGNPLKELNSYVIKGNGESNNLLIDTGFQTKECYQCMTESLDKLGISMDNTDILLTHLHADHSGNAAALIKENNKVYLSAMDTEVLLSHSRSLPGGGMYEYQRNRLIKNQISPELVDKMLVNSTSYKVNPDYSFMSYTKLDEGNIIEAGDYKLKAIYTNGHTPGHMCFSVEGTGIMFLGDHVLFGITPNITNWPGVEDSLGDYLKSLDKISKYDVSIPLPGHRQTGNFYERIESLKAHHERRLNECLDIIGNSQKAKLYDIAGNMKWKIRAANWEDFPALQKWFALGECLSHIDLLKKQGKIKECGSDKIWYELS